MPLIYTCPVLYSTQSLGMHSMMLSESGPLHTLVIFNPADSAIFLHPLSFRPEPPNFIMLISISEPHADVFALLSTISTRRIRDFFSLDSAGTMFSRIFCET